MQDNVEVVLPQWSSGMPPNRAIGGQIRILSDPGRILPKQLNSTGMYCGPVATARVHSDRGQTFFPLALITYEFMDC